MSGSFHDQIAANRRDSGWLVAAFILLVGLVVFLFGVALGGGSARAGFGAAAFGLVVATIVAIWGTYAGSSTILALSRARKISKVDDPQLWNVVEELSIAAGVPVPAIYTIDDSAQNAFATGRDPAHASVAITTGLRSRLTRDELQGVLAHELSHVRNLDVRFTMLLAVLVGLLVLLCDFFRRSLWWGRVGRRRSSGSSGPWALVAIVLALLLSIVAPLLAKLIQLAASRRREYLADASSVELTRNPNGLADALEKIAGDTEVLEAANRATQHLYIVNPIHPFEERARGLFSTHPPIQERIRRLRELAGAPGTDAEAAPSGRNRQ
jgi:heat shock protein HtpX